MSEGLRKVFAQDILEALADRVDALIAVSEDGTWDQQLRWFQKVVGQVAAMEHELEASNGSTDDPPF